MVKEEMKMNISLKYIRGGVLLSTSNTTFQTTGGERLLGSSSREKS